MPYQNEHAARIKSPSSSKDVTTSRKQIAPGISIILQKEKSDVSMQTQAYRFSKSKFTAAEAKKWLKDHNIKYMLFEPASGGDNG